MKTLKTLIVSGSVRKGRQTHKVSQALHQRFLDAGYGNTQLLDIADFDFPIATERFGKLDVSPARIEEAQALLQQSEAMVFVSPEYHGSYSGALKNFLDYFWAEFTRKPIGVSSVSTGRFGGINASVQMQQLVLSLGGYAMPQKLVLPAVHTAFNEDGSVKDEFLTKSLDKFVSEFSWFAEAITEKRGKQ